MIITGDFNVKEIDWVNHFTNTNPNHLAYKIFDLINDKFLNQLITEPNRYRRGETANTLDLKRSKSVDHIHLCEKICLAGLDITWFASYLSNRKQMVFVSNIKSDEAKIKQASPKVIYLVPCFICYIVTTCLHA